MKRTPVVSLLMASLTLALASPLHAETAPEKKEELLSLDFGALIQDARDAYENENYERAITGLTLANRQNPNPRLLINIARSYERADQCRPAMAYYEAFLRAPGSDASLRQETEAALQEGIAACPEYEEDAAGRLIIESEPLIARAYLNDELVGVTPLEVAGLPPGSYEIRIEKEDFAPFTETIELFSAEDHSFQAALQEPPEEVAPPVADIAEPPPAAEQPPNYIAYGLMGAGVLAIGLGSYFDLVEIPSIDEEREQARLAGDQARVDDLTARRGQTATYALSGYIAGGLLIVGGASWLVYDHFFHEENSSNSTPAWALAPSVHPSAMGFQLMRRF